MLVAPPGERFEDARVRDFDRYVPPGSLLVLNDTKVRKARLLANKATGGKVELLFLRPEAEPRTWRVLATGARKLTPGTELRCAQATVRILGRAPEGALSVRLGGVEDEEAFFREVGRVPLPPYIQRAPEPEDAERYQTVFARHVGSAAAPTAGLHLTADILQRLQARGVQLGRVTLHVGAGTFLPVRTERLEDHPMHREEVDVGSALVEQVRAAQARASRVIAVGTTVVRALESAAASGQLAPFRGETSLMISPGYRFRVVEGLLTNFHAPRSTLLALVSAFMGDARRRSAYAHALASGYRFLSYGDALWLPARSNGGEP